ncbi:uncharacterized protein LOC120756725 isoform X2 [Hirundo rustica]|uniref:uncharacterized protein LOC120756725 isoform X2 n=1 Tax=Hirundo rustica TaxID=43150 RepID=UPI001A9533BE|nr:uncharacterized protein LOC120756725 isoform X2 [Hirundo rustica]
MCHLSQMISGLRYKVKIFTELHHLPHLSKSNHKPQKTLWKKHTGPTHPVDMTQSTVQFGILSTLKKSHIRKKSWKQPAPCRKTEPRWAEKCVVDI